MLSSTMKLPVFPNEQYIKVKTNPMHTGDEHTEDWLFDSLDGSFGVSIDSQSSNDESENDITSDENSLKTGSDRQLSDRYNQSRRHFRNLNEFMILSYNKVGRMFGWKKALSEYEMVKTYTDTFTDAADDEVVTIVL